MYDETSSSTDINVPIAHIYSIINWIEFVNQEKIMKTTYQWWHVQKYDQQSAENKIPIELLYLYFFQSLGGRNNQYDNFTYPTG